MVILNRVKEKIIASLSPRAKIEFKVIHALIKTVILPQVQIKN